MRVPSRSPSPPPTALNGRLEDTVDVFANDGKTEEEKREELAAKEAHSRAVFLSVAGDIDDADEAPPDNVLFVCKVCNCVCSFVFSNFLFVVFQFSIFVIFGVFVFCSSNQIARTQLNPVTSDEDLEIIFSRFGTILSCEVMRDSKTGESLNYAFIEFQTPQSCEAAYLKMDNVLIDDRRIHVDFSQSVKRKGGRFRLSARAEAAHAQQAEQHQASRRERSQAHRHDDRSNKHDDRSSKHDDRSRRRSRSPRRERSRSPSSHRRR